MPSIVRPIPAKKTILVRKLSKRQIALVKKIRKARLRPMMYKRAGNAKGWSVHNPFIDAKRRGREAFTPYAQRMHPQAWDSAAQIRFAKRFKSRKNLAKKVKKIRAAGKRKKGFMDIFSP